MNELNETELAARARDLRISILRMICEAGSGHPGGSLSAVDILCALYFGGVLIHDPKTPQAPNRDRFVLSKGHAAPALYATLAYAGYFPKDELKTLRKLDSRLQGHPDMRLLPGIEVSTGSLGQGFSVACGMALGLRLNESQSFVFSLLGDGECEEGIVWEAAMFAAHKKLDNLVALVDLNGLQIDGACAQVCNPNDIGEKFKAFGWEIQTVDGHDIPKLIDALSETKATHSGKPKCIIAKTVKGKGVSFMENQVGWHGKAPNEEQLEQALKELGVNSEEAAAC